MSAIEIHRPFSLPSHRPVGHALNITTSVHERSHVALGMRLETAHAVLAYAQTVDDLAYAYLEYEYADWTERLHSAVKHGDWKAMRREADALLAMINGVNGLTYCVDFRARAAAWQSAESM
jgi:hypothetical protein